MAVSFNWKLLKEIVYKPLDPMNQNNLDDLEDEYDDAFKSVFGAPGSFIKSGAYTQKPMPPLPVLLSSVDPLVIASMDFVLTMKTHVDQRASVQKFNDKAIDSRAQMFAILLGKAQPGARDHMTRDPDYAALADAGDDPLALWELMRRSLVNTELGNPIAQEGAARESYSKLVQGDKMDVTTFKKLFLNKHTAMVAAGCTAMAEQSKAFDFHAKLHKPRFGEMLRHIENGLLARPLTVDDAYVMAYNYKTTITRTADSYVGEEMDAKKSKERTKDKPKHAGDGSKKKSPPKKRIEGYHHYFNLAKRLGYEPGSCNNCGKHGHRIGSCQSPLQKLTEADCHVADVEDYWFY